MQLPFLTWTPPLLLQGGLSPAVRGPPPPFLAPSWSQFSSGVALETTPLRVLTKCSRCVLSAAKKKEPVAHF